MLIIGSYASKRNISRCNDVDVIAYLSDTFAWIENNKANIINYYPDTPDKIIVLYRMSNEKVIFIEFNIAYSDSTNGILVEDKRSYTEDKDTIFGLGHFATLEVCLMLKMSHRYLKNSSHFWKTMLDINLLRVLLPNGISDWLNPILKKRESETYTYNHPKLNQKKDSFFSDDNIVYKFDHDELHQVVKLYDRPAYQYFKPEEQEVYCSKDMFEDAEEHIKLAAVYEESCVLALERSMIPFDGSLDYENAFMLALSKVCTSITSGWFREYAWENAYKVIELFMDQQPTKSYYNLFKVAEKTEQIKPIGGK